MLVPQLKATTNQFNVQQPNQPQPERFFFEYGNNEWQNLGDYQDDANVIWIERKKYFLLLWQDREAILNEHSATTGYIFTGDMILSVRSKLTEKDFDYKYETHIKNLYEISERFKDIMSDCGEQEWEIKSWKETTVNDVYDTNMDGLKISFRVQVNLQ